MKAYIIKRLLLIIPTFIGISFITFMMLQLAPGSPVYQRLYAAGDGGNVSAKSVPPEYIEELKKMYGLDKPLPIRYVIWVKKMALFDFGDSYKDHQPVIKRIGQTLPVSIQLSVISIFLIYVISVPIGVYSSVRQHTWQDSITTLGLFVLYSLPSFWVAMLLMYFFGGGQFLDWFPVYGLNSTGADKMTWYQWLADRAWHLVLPVFCLTYGGLAGLSRYARAGMIETIRQDYIRTAHAYGFSGKVVVFKYAMRNSLIPIITLLGTLLPALIGGSVIIETIFSIPGMGRLAFEAMLSRDYPLVMGVLTISALLTLVGLILSDIMYAITDPRIKFE
jgi:peptide/nickel transport system permease protein